MKGVPMLAQVLKTAMAAEASRPPTPMHIDAALQFLGGAPEHVA